ncbi:MAG: TRIC cation channel family protein [Tetrasphaera sp.]
MSGQALAVGPLTILDVSTAFRIVDLAGVFCNGALGATVARRRGFDFVGFVVLGVVSALAGGMIRDVMLQIGQPVALTDRAYLVVAMIGVLTAQLVKMEGRRWDWPLSIGDALALGCWAATGTIKAQLAGLSALASIMLGVVTAVGGGMVRDICVGQVPRVLGGNSVPGGNTLYATAAAAASIAILLVPRTDRSTWGMAVGIVIGGGMTLIARRRKWTLPLDADFGVTLSAAEFRALVRSTERTAVETARQARDVAVWAARPGAWRLDPRHRDGDPTEPGAEEGGRGPTPGPQR